jgi:hypothetical protein
MTFTPGEYRTRGGYEAVVLEVMPDGNLIGRFRREGLGHWTAMDWQPSGRGIRFSGAHDIIPPPPVVVSDETVKKFCAAMDWAWFEDDVRLVTALIAAICNHMAEQQ